MGNVACLTDEIMELQLRRCGASLLLDRALAVRLREEQSRAAAFDVAPRRGVVWSREPTAEAGERIDFRPHARPGFELRLGYSGVEAIRRELAWAAPEGVESGGYLWSRDQSQDIGVCVAHVSPAEGSRHGPTSAQLGRPESIAEAWPDWLARSEMVVVGCWHSHPLSDGTPSRPDLAAWAARVTRSGGFPWASLIVTRGEDGAGWSGPRFTGWVTSPDGRGGYICEPARVIEP